MGIGSKIKKGIKTGAKSLGLDDPVKVLLTGGLSVADKAMGQVYGTNVTEAYQDNISGHTAKAKSEREAYQTMDAQKTLAKANADVDRDAADIVLGETNDGAGESLTELRKKKGSTVSTQLGIV